MSDEKTDTAPGTGPDGSASPNPTGAKAGKGRLIAIVAGAVVLSLLAGGGGVYWFTRDKSAHGAAKAEEASAPEAEGEGGDAEADPSKSYIDVPPMMVNLRGGGAEARFVKLHFIVVAANGKTDEVKARLPVILDALQPFLRELRPDDLNGSAAVFRIKEEMMRRCDEALGPGKVRDVLIQDLIQQ